MNQDVARSLFRQWFKSPHPVVRYFSADELLCKTTKGTNTIPPIDLWMNILPTVQILDEVRGLLGYPIHLNSVYRNETYNQGVGGTPGSMHLLFNAIDFVGAKGNTQDWIDVIMSMKVGYGGLSKYPKFVHLDTRTIWPGRKQVIW